MSSDQKYLPRSATPPSVSALFEAVDSISKAVIFWQDRVTFGPSGPIRRYEDITLPGKINSWRSKTKEFEDVRDLLAALLNQVHGQPSSWSELLEPTRLAPEIMAAKAIYTMVRPGKLCKKNLLYLSEDTLLHILMKIEIEINHMNGIEDVWKSAWNEIKVDAFSRLRPAERPLEGTSVQYGVYTALELEFQAVLRRMDEIHLISDQNSPGHQLQRMTDLASDLYDRTHPENRNGLGIALGKIGEATVLVVCCSEWADDYSGGRQGKLTRERSVKRAMIALEKEHRILARQWLLVGVCGGGAMSRPLGSVLISQGGVCIVDRPRSERYQLSREHAPHTVQRKALGDLADLGPGYVNYEQTAALLAETHYKLAAPNAVPIGYVPFASVDHLVHRNSDRTELLKVMKDITGAPDDFGFEMEFRGIADFGDSGEPYGFPNTLIVKSVVDYGSETDKDIWGDRLKSEIKYYAADLAAEATARLIRDDAILPIGQY